MHVDDVAGTGPLVQVVDILGDKRHAATAPGKLPFQAGERRVGRIRFRGDQVLPPRIVEFMHLNRVSCKRFGRCQFFIGSNRAHSPVPSLSRNVPSPLSAEMPAPVRTNSFISVSPIRHSLNRNGRNGKAGATATGTPDSR